VPSPKIRSIRKEEPVCPVVTPPKKVSPPSPPVPVPTEADMMDIVGYLQSKGKLKAFALKFQYGLHYDRHEGKITLCPL
jgi:hypothetical protein